MSEADTAPNVASDDLSFLKSLVNEGPKAQATAGQLFMTAGTLYGVQCLLDWMMIVLKGPWPQWMWMAVGFLPTIAFLVVMGAVIWRDRNNRIQGVAARALNAAYTSAGLANLFVVIIFAFNAIEQKSTTLWLLYPAVICVFQGSAWYVSYVIRRRPWLACISAGWFLTGLSLGFLIHDVTDYLLLLGIALFVLMGGGGFYMWRTAQK